MCAFSYDATKVADDNQFSAEQIERGKETLLARYQTALSSIPAPGGGGCHSSLLSVANLGALAGLDAQTIFNDIRRNIPRGNRNVPDNEIMSAVKRGLSDKDVEIKPSPPCVQKVDPKAILRLWKGSITKMSELREQSPTEIPTAPIDQALLMLRTLYTPDEFLFGGERVGKKVFPVRQCIEWLEAGFEPPPYIIPNPMTGAPGLTKSGTSSFRCDSAVADLRWAVAEFDAMSIERQVAFWSGCPLPVQLITYSGNKSIHVWIRVNCCDDEIWERVVKHQLYEAILIPAGVDRTCRNPSRLMRFPGHLRADTGHRQELLWLADDVQGMSSRLGG